MDQHILIAPQILKLTPHQRTEIAAINHEYEEYMKTVDASATGGTTYINNYDINRIIKLIDNNKLTV